MHVQVENSWGDAGARSGCKVGAVDLGSYMKGGQGSSASQGSPAQLCREQRGGDAAEMGWEVEFNWGLLQIRDAFQKCWESCPKRKSPKIKGAFIMKEIPGACKAKQSPGQCHCFPSHAGRGEQQPDKTKRGWRQRYRLGAPREPVA